jgi:hypothetical protein
MGLDQYLWRKKCGDIYDFKKDYPECTAKKLTIKVISEFADGDIKEKEYTVENPKHDGSILIPQAYWRKANAIHGWILRNTVGEDNDNCQPIEIEGIQLVDLINDCKTVLADHTKAKDLLPVMEGFFFGSYEYDEWYFEDLENTIKQLEGIEPTDSFVYRASW